MNRLPRLILAAVFTFILMFFLVDNVSAAPGCSDGLYQRCQDGECTNPEMACKKYERCVERDPNGNCTKHEWGCKCLIDIPDVTTVPSSTPIPTPTIRQPFPPPYVPCYAVRNPEFHSLRPYQASPCNRAKRDLALSCGNDLLVYDELSVLKQFIPYGADIYFRLIGEVYYFEGNRIEFPNCTENNDGTETCFFSFPREKKIAIDLSRAYLPIMGNTELVVNSQEQFDEVMPKYIDDPAKVNEYASWYLNGIIGRAEYDPPDMSTENGVSRIVNYSGPLKKLLSFDSQEDIRFDEIRDAFRSRFVIPPANIRHDQNIGCVNFLNQKTECYPTRTLVTPYRMTQMRNPVIRAATGLLSYTPFSSTEDRMGEVEMQTSPIQYISPDLYLTGVILLNNKPADLFFSHMQEVYELADILQDLLVPKDAEKE